MFYKNSNDLVKQASVNSGHVQNSYATQQQLINQGHYIDASNRASIGGSTGSASLDIGAQFQNAMNSLIGSFTYSIEGIDGAGSIPSVANPETGPVGANGDQTPVLNNIVQQNNNYVEQEETHRNRINAVRNIAAEDKTNSRGQWAQVIDTEGITKYGYITKDRIFQIWLAPTDPRNNPQNWFETPQVKNNSGVLGCPANSGNLTKLNIGARWDDIKPFDMVYAQNDTSRKTPVFMLTNDGVRDVKRTPNSSGLFSCGNERTNIFVKERPSADFETGNGLNNCYELQSGKTANDIIQIGFKKQEDLGKTNIPKCKRRAEDLGRSFFIMSQIDNNRDENRPELGDCYIYERDGKPNMSSIGSVNTSGDKCISVSRNNEEDGYMMAYSDSNFRKMGVNTTKTITKQAKCPPRYSTNTPDSNQDCYAGWHPDCAEDCHRNSCAQSGGTWIPKDYRYNGYTCRMAKPIEETVTTNSVALYSLKTDGPNGVDQTDRNGRGMVGRIAYIDHNGDKHDYPESALSYIKSGSGSDASGSMTYVNIGPYDTRSAESSYSLREITPGAFSDAGNLLYKASRDGWTPAAFHKKCDNKGPTYTRAIINDGRVLGAYTSLSWSSSVQNYAGDSTAFLYDGTTKFTPNNSVWGTNPPYSTYMNSSYMPTFGGGHDFYISGQSIYNNAFTFLTNDKKAPFGKTAQSYQSFSISDLEVYAVDATTFPKTMEYAKRVRTMPIGESITATMEKCQGLCDGDEKCGGFVYTKGGSSSDGKCELKDKTKMYPAGLRIVDHTKRLMLKVPSINGTIEDTECAKSGKGQFNLIDSARYMYYPAGGAMNSGTKCNIATMVPKQGNLQMPDVAPAINAVNTQSTTTNTKITEYKNQMSANTDEGFNTLREGLDIETDPGNSTYGKTMSGVRDTLIKIGNASYQRERLDAIKDESNKLLIAETYKFILWSILAILAVIALLKIKEMFGQDEADTDADAGGEGSGGILGFITSLFGIGAVKLDDIADKTGDVKTAIGDAGVAIQQTGENLVTGITEGADNLVTSVNDAANNAADGAKNMAVQASETATNAINSIGEAAAGATGATGAGAGEAKTGGKTRR